MDNKKIILPELRNQTSEELDLDLKLQLEQDSRHIVETDRTVILTQSEQYDRERQKSNKYRLTGVIRPIWKNMTDVLTENVDILSEMFFNSKKIDDIINLTSVNTPDEIPIGSLPGKISSDELDFIRKDYIGSNDPNSFGLYNNGQGFGPRMADDINWNVYITYPSNKLTSKTISVQNENGTATKTLNIKFGLPYFVNEVDGYFEFYSPFDHGLVSGDYVSINNFLYTVDDVGNNKYRSERKYFYISKGQFDSSVTTVSLNGVTYGFKKVIDKNNPNETTSMYYVVQNKVLKTHSDIDLQRNAFESSIFEDEKKLPKYFVSNDTTNANYGTASFNNDGKVVTQENGDTYMFIVPSDINVGALEDHLERDITKLSVSILFKNTMLFFDRQQGGFEEQFGWGNEDTLLSEDDELYSNVNDKVVKSFVVGDLIDGDLCEFNPYTLEERVISKRVNRMIYNPDLFNIEEGPNYFYQVHNDITLRYFSDYIEENNTNDVYNLPKNARYIAKEKRWIWRDLWDKGYINPNGLGVNYPFINDSHYVNSIINFYIKPDTVDGLTNDRKTITDINPFLIDNCE